MDLKGVVNGYTNRGLDSVNALAEEKKKEAVRRFSICESCTVFDKESKHCDKSKGGCGCNMETKVYCTFCTCPKNKW